MSVGGNNARRPLRIETAASATQVVVMVTLFIVTLIGVLTGLIPSGNLL